MTDSVSQNVCRSSGSDLYFFCSFLSSRWNSGDSLKFIVIASYGVSFVAIEDALVRKRFAVLGGFPGDVVVRVVSDFGSTFI